jgi:ammonia channel protein AmtB
MSAGFAALAGALMIGKRKMTTTNLPILRM